MIQNNTVRKKTTWRVVYYGAAKGGKTTNLQFIFEQTPPANRGELTSIASQEHQYFFYDYMSFKLDVVLKTEAKFQLYTVPGAPTCYPVRQFLLRDVDGIIFVVDSQYSKMHENFQSLRELQHYLREVGKEITSIPIVFQYNKRDLPESANIEELNKQLNYWNFPYQETTAFQGNGVFQTLQLLTRLMLNVKKNDTALHRNPQKKETSAYTAPKISQKTVFPKPPQPAPTSPPAPVPQAYFPPQNVPPKHYPPYAYPAPYSNVPPPNNSVPYPPPQYPIYPNGYGYYPELYSYYPQEPPNQSQWY